MECREKDLVKIKSIKSLKKIIFLSVMLVMLALVLEVFLRLGGYVYFNVYSNLDNPLVEEDAFRILSLGESTTAGAGARDDPSNATQDRDYSYSGQLERILQLKYPDKKIRVYNKGIGSIETTGILKNLDRNMIKYKPQLTLIMAGGNDRPVADETANKLKVFYASLKFTG